MRRNSPSEPPLVFEPEDLEIETTDGRRPAGTAGDRMMVGLAALALLGGALIAITNALPDDPQTSSASASADGTEPGASRTPRPTPSPPAQRSVQVVDEPLPSADPVQQRYVGWIRALEEIRIRSSPSFSSLVLATLRPGDAAWVQGFTPEWGDTPGWMQLETPQIGWIRPNAGGRSVIQRYPYRDQQAAGSIDRLAAGVNGFIGVGWQRTSDGQYSSQLYRSADGAHWRVGETPDLLPIDGVQVAYGPAGWLLMSSIDDDSGSSLWVWQSVDMGDWQLLGAIRDMAGEGIGQLAGSEEGYVIVGGNGRGGGGTLWYSRDGLVWTERFLPYIPDGGWHRITSTPLGFYVDSGASGPAAYSPDGWTWSEVSTDGMGTVVGVAAAGDQLVALDSSSGGSGNAWVGTIRGSILTWQEDQLASAAFEGAVLTALASDGQRPIAFGWERGTDRTLWWTRDSARWQRHELAADFEGIPRATAGGSAGTVVIGYRPGLIATSPVVWHLGPNGTWAPEAAPAIELPDSSAEDCGDPPGDILDLLARDARWLAHCFGDRPITFRAWSAVCEGCNYEGPGTYATKWLQQPTDNLMFLSPIRTGEWGTVEGVLSPSLERDERWLDHWVEVTGHYDDPAAASCRLQPDVSEEMWYEGPAEVINQCRARFVVTAVTVVRGPR